MNEIKNARLIKTDASRAIELPSGFELPAEFDRPDTEISVTREGDKLIVKALPPGDTPRTFREMLDRMETIDIEWPDVDEGLLPPDVIKL